MVGAPSFSQPYLCIYPPLQSPPKIRSSTSVNFHLPIPPLLLNKIILTIPTSTPFLCTSAIFSSLFLCTTIPAIFTKNILPTSAIQATSRNKGAMESCGEWHCFNLSLLPQSIGIDNRTRNH